MLDPTEAHAILMPILDRIVAPIVKQIENMDARQREDTANINAKLDAAAGVAHKVSAAETRVGHLENHIDQVRDEVKFEIDKIKTDLLTLTAETYKTAGRNQVIVWVLGLIGAPITVILIAAGIAKLFNVKLGL